MSSNEFIVIDHEQFKNCNDIEGYDFIADMEGCKEALDYFKTNDPTLVKSPTVYDNYRTKTLRPFGCYWYKWGKKLVHPRNTPSSPGSDSDSVKKQVCKKVALDATSVEETNNPNYTIVADGKNCMEKGYRPLTQTECQGSITSLAETPLTFAFGTTNIVTSDTLNTTDSPNERPPGCYVYNNDVWFNTNNTGDGNCNMDQRFCLCSSTRLSSEEIENYNNQQEQQQEQQQNAATSTTPSDLPKVLPATIIPYCQITQGTEKGEDVVVTEEIYSCPAKTMIFCPENYTLQELNKGCSWSGSGTEPSVNAPKPLCKPTEQKIVFSSLCNDGQITEEECKDGINCNTDEKKNCTCPDDVDVTKVTCRDIQIKTEERTGDINCGSFGGTLACPDGYQLNSETKMCILGR